MCAATNDALSHKRLAGDKESRFLSSMKTQRPITLKEHTVQLNIARKRHPKRSSKKNLDELYEVLASGSVVQKTYQFTSVIREPRKLEVTVRNSDTAKFGNRYERKTKLTEYINHRGSRAKRKINRGQNSESYKRVHTNSEKQSKDETPQT